MITKKTNHNSRAPESPKHLQTLDWGGWTTFSQNMFPHVLFSWWWLTHQPRMWERINWSEKKETSMLVNIYPVTVALKWWLNMNQNLDIITKTYTNIGYRLTDQQRPFYWAPTALFFHILFMWYYIDYILLHPLQQWRNVNDFFNLLCRRHFRFQLSIFAIGTTKSSTLISTVLHNPGFSVHFEAYKRVKRNNNKNRATEKKEKRLK